MDLEKYVKEAFENAVEKGFNSCPECEGNEKLEGYPDPDCKTCGGNGINPNVNIGEKLALIISELGEALEAHSCGRFCFEGYINQINEDFVMKDRLIDNTPWFEKNTKDTFEDKIADVAIRIFELCGYLHIDLHKINPPTHHIKWYSEDNISDDIYRMMQLAGKVHLFEKQELTVYMVYHLFAHLLNFAERREIPIEKYIKAKMAYNQTRPEKHGKEY